MTRRFPTISRAVVTIITVDSVGATQVARGVPGGPAATDADQVELIASPPARQPHSNWQQSCSQASQGRLAAQVSTASGHSCHLSFESSECYEEAVGRDLKETIN